MAAVLSAPPDVAREFAFRHSRIPRPVSSGSVTKRGDETSPKSVIADIRFVSPGSSSSGSSSIERRSLPDASSLLRKQPCNNSRYGGSSSYSTSDGEFSDPDSSVSTSRELNKVGNSGPLESLPETEAANPDQASKPSPCRIPLFPSANASGSEATALYVLADRTNDVGRAAAASRPVGRVSSEVKDEAASPGSASARLYTTTEGGARRREYGLRPTFSAELSSSGKPLEERPMGPGAAANFGYAGTPLRFIPGWQGPVNGARSPHVEKAPTAYNLTPSSSDVGLRHQHRFLSGPIMGSMIPKPPPSKWDDADKWIVSPNRKESPTQPQRSLQTLLTGRRHSMAGSQSVRSHASPDYATPAGEKPMSAEFQTAFINAGKVAVLKHSRSPKKRSKALSFSDISRKFEPPRAVSGKPTSQPAAKRETARAKSNTVAPEQKPSKPSSKVNELPLLKHDVAEAQPPVESAADESQAAIQAKESPTKDMATQVTPVESLKNSTCTTPGLAPSPTRHCNTPAGRRASSLGAVPAVIDLLELQGCHLAKLELRQLAGDDRAAGSLERKSVWTTREEEEILSSASLREEAERGQAASEASAWEDAERSKVLVRFQSKEAKIKAWEEQQRAQAEADMKKVEAKVERILTDAAEKMQEKLACTARKAAEMRAAAESERRVLAAKAAARAELMRKAEVNLSPASTSSSKVASFRSCFRVR